MNDPESAQVLKLILHDVLIGYLVGYQSGRNELIFADDFRNDPQRPTFSLTTHPHFANADKVLSKTHARNQRIHPTLSNLLPEGALRELLAQGLKTHTDNEFRIFSYLGLDLPGAVIATAMAPDEVPEHILSNHGKTNAIKMETQSPGNRFSLAGVQMKFSMKEKDGRYQLAQNGELGDWIIKTPSTRHKDVPLNEYTAMKLAALAGVDIPEIQLVDMGSIDTLPQINLPNEQQAFAIKRFDREGQARIHMEDFAQVLVKYPHQKYEGGNYENIGKILYDYTGDGLANVQQFARRLLVNILLANGDAHLKNWSLLYPDQITPELSPAYDIVTTSVYIEGEKEFALNLVKNKEWARVNLDHFERFAKKSGAPWRAIKPHLNDTMNKARELWPIALKDLPMNTSHKKQLINHWSSLHADFQIETNAHKKSR
ncbi:MAG: type II toxin-antitoxin system HipA family toxin [Gammaproteobacteria bacterium]|nr:type II toxin-antitoxin system HipA family toxin [Gammaproteobacteria bacterium]